MKNKPRNNVNLLNGFGLIEVLISASILTLVAGSTLTLQRTVLKNNTVSQDNNIGYNLAREGVELLRANRDTKWIDSQVNNWSDDFVIQNESQDSYYVFSWDQDNNFSTIFISNNPIQSADKEGIINSNQKYTRYFVAQKMSADPDILETMCLDDDGSCAQSSANNNNRIYTQITMVVEWNENGKDFRTEIPFTLANWKPAL